MGDKLICPICGEQTSVYMGNARKDRLCRNHAKLLKDGALEKCLDCGEWFLTSEGCKCKQQKKNIDEKIQKQEIKNTLRCIICGMDSNGMHFCRACYSKYKDRSVDIRITYCNETEILDEYGNLQYKCADGRKVRSRAEVMISDFLYNNKVRSVYEETIYYKENGEDKTLHPDFFLPDYDIYIEYNELTNKPYLKSKEYTQKIYKNLGYDVLIMTDKDIRDIAACLKPKLGLH